MHRYWTSETGLVTEVEEDAMEGVESEDDE